MIVSPIHQNCTHEWLLKVHYAHRIPQIQYAFGLYVDGTMIGVCTYGIPSASPLREGIAGKENSKYVLELNRLVLSEQIKNAASYLVAKSLQMLPKPSIVVSYADIAQGHVGYVYQACNFIYTGLSAKRTDWHVKGLEHLHSQTIVDISKSKKGQGKGSRVAHMKEIYGDDFSLKERSRKHRYIFVVGSRQQKNKLIGMLKYKKEEYPKGESKNYQLEKIYKQSSLFDAKVAA